MDNAVTFFSENYNQNINIDDYAASRGINAVTFFSENYNQNINIDDYAASRGMSVSWFIRNFKKYTVRCYLKQQLIPSMRFLRLSDMITSFISAGFFTSWKDIRQENTEK